MPANSATPAGEGVTEGVIYMGGRCCNRRDTGHSGPGNRSERVKEWPAAAMFWSRGPASCRRDVRRIRRAGGVDSLTATSRVSERSVRKHGVVLPSPSLRTGLIRHMMSDRGSSRWFGASAGQRLAQFSLAEGDETLPKWVDTEGHGVVVYGACRQAWQLVRACPGGPVRQPARRSGRRRTGP